MSIRQITDNKTNLKWKKKKYNGGVKNQTYFQVISGRGHFIKFVAEKFKSVKVQSWIFFLLLLIILKDAIYGTTWDWGIVLSEQSHGTMSAQTVEAGGWEDEEDEEEQQHQQHQQQQQAPSCWSETNPVSLSTVWTQQQ